MTMNHIILVEDDPDDVYFFKSGMRDCERDCDITVMENGDNLFRFLDRSEVSDEMESSLIFLDLNLPKMSGFDILTALKEQKLLNKLAIVIYTTSNYQKDIDKAYELGAKSYFIKPSKRGDLISLLNTTTDYWFNYNELPRMS